MNFSLFLPEIVLSCIIVATLFLTLRRSPAKLDGLMALAATAVLASTVLALDGSGSLFHGTYRVDLFSQGFKALLAAALTLTILISRLSETKLKTPEFYLFLLTATLGMMLLTSAVDLLTFVVALELSSYSLYVLSGIKRDRRSAESAVKYLIFGAASSGLLLWGLSMLAGLSGTTSLIEIAKAAPALASQPAFLVGALLAMIAFLFKLSGFPAHFWAPDVYESSPTSVTAFIATASKAAAVAILIRFFMVSGLEAGFTAAVGAVAFISMTLGNCTALVQKDVKRLLAYSSIAQAGYILVGLLAGTPEGYSASIFYAVAYVIMNAAAFLVVQIVAADAKNDNPQITDFDGLADRAPMMALILLLSLLSLAGIPPLAGFTGKWILFTAAMQKGHWFLVLWGVLNSVVSLFYYLTVVKRAYLGKSKTGGAIVIPGHLKALGLGLFLAIVLVGIYPNPLITFSQQAIAATRLS